MHSYMKIFVIITIVAVAMIELIVPSAFAHTITDDSTGGDCSTIETWDSGSKTCTLLGDVNEAIVIGSNGIILDGNDYAVTGPGTQGNENTIYN
jgi:hypothetical protein